MADAESLDVRLARVEEQNADMHTDIHEIKTDVREIKLQMSGRPTWAVVTLITVLSSLVVGLAVALASISAT